MIRRIFLLLALSLVFVPHVLAQSATLTTKSISPASTVAAGTSVTITVTLNNTGNNTLFSVSVTGTGCAPFLGDTSALAPGTSRDFTCTFTPATTTSWNATGVASENNGLPPISTTSTGGTITVIHPSTTLSTKSIVPNTTVAAGTAVTITVTETNTGDSTISNVSVTGTGCSVWTGGISTLTAGAATDFICTFTPSTTTGWTATGHGQDTLGNDVPLTGETTSGTVTVLHPSTTLTTKSVTPGTNVAPGTPVTITVTETNTGDSAITNVSVTGTGCTPWTGGSATLIAGAATDFSCTFTPSTTTAWTATGHAKDTFGNDVPLTGETTSGTVTVTAIHPSTTLTTKSVTPGTTVISGTPVTITVTETNTGDSTITNVSVTGTGCIQWTGGSTTLLAGAATDFTCTFTANTTTPWTATGHGTDSLGNAVPAANETTSGTITVTGSSVTTLTTLSVTPGTTIAAGTSLTITVTETNNSSSTISNVSVTGTGCVSWAGGASTLAGGASTNFSCTFAPSTTTAWTATAHGVDNFGNPLPTTGETTNGTITVIHPSTTLTTKTVLPGTTVASGTPVTITVTETNTGDSTITNVSVTGTGCSPWTGGSTTLASGGATDFSCTFTANATTLWTATGHGKDTLGNDVPAANETTSGSITVSGTSSTTLTTKNVTPGTVVAAGTPVTITVTETNNTASAINSVSVTGTGCTPWTGGSTVLGPGASTDFSCTFTPSITTQWTATGHGKDSFGSDLPATGETTGGTVTVIHPSTILTTKSVSPGTSVGAGTSVTITVTETNTGDVVITNVSVTGVSCTTWTGGNTTLAAGASTDFSCTFTPNSTTLWIATGHGKDSIGNDVPTVNETTSGTITVNGASATTLTTKSVTPGTTIASGTAVTITVTETNTSASTISNVSVTGTGCASWTGGSSTLAAGASTDFSCTFVPSTTTAWSATGNGTDTLGNPLPVTGETTQGVITVIHPSVTLSTKSVLPGIAVPPGTNLTITVTATNIGDVPIANVNVTGTGACLAYLPLSVSVLSGGDSADFTCSFIANTNGIWSATVSATDSLGNPLPSAKTNGSFSVGHAVRTNQGFTTTSLARGDDAEVSSSSVSPGFALKFFNATYNSLFINNNGNVTFGQAYGGHPRQLGAASLPILAPFWADVDTRAAASSTVTYGTDIVNGRAAFGVNYVNVGYGTQHSDKLNSFQVVLIDRSDTGTGNFDFEFNYDRIVWETGDVDGGVNGLYGTSASAGFSDGTADPSRSFQLPGSLTPGSFLDLNPNGLIWRTQNSLNVLGRLVFAVRGGQVVMIQPSTSLVTKSVVPGPVVTPGSTVTITVTERNTGDSPISNVSVTGTGCSTWSGSTSFLDVGASTDFSCTLTPTASTTWTATGHGTDVLGNDVPPTNETTGGTIIVSSGPGPGPGPGGLVVISTIDPTSRVAGGPSFTLTVTGTNFSVGSIVAWNGQPLDTTYINSSQLTALVPTNLITTPGSAIVSVTLDSVPSSFTKTFTIAPPPIITSLTPNFVAAGGPSFTLTVSGANFSSDASVLWNGRSLAVTSVNTSLITATVPAEFIVSVGKAGVVVSIQGVSSNSQDVTIVAPVITSIDPNAVTAGGSAFTLTINGSGFVAGATARWNGSALPTTFISQNQLTASVSAPLIATAGIVSITASIQTAVSNSASLTVSPTLTSLSPTSTAAGGSAFTLTVNGAGFADSSTVFWNETALATTFTDSTRLSASVPANLISSPASVQITAASGGARSNALTFTVQSASKVTITGLDPAPVPTQGTNVGISLDAPAPAPLQGTLTLTFRPAAGLPTGFIDPFLQFAAGGTVLNFTVPAGATVATLPQNGAIQLGTVAGDITVTLTRLLSGTANVLPSPAPSRTLTVSKLVPVITPNSVRITNVTANGLDVEATAYSTTLELVSANYTFQIASGVRLTGSATATVNLQSVASQWYANTQYGGMVRLRVHFPIQGDPNFIQGVSLTLTNTVGPSAAVSGGK